MNHAHDIQADIDYVGKFIFETTSAPADPTDLIKEESEWENLPAAPPPISGYRPADIAGIACWNCGHFTIVGDPDNDGDLDGICELFETQADAQMTCDKFTAHADLARQGPHTSWQEDLNNMSQDARRAGIAEMDYADNSVLNSFYFTGDSNVAEEDGLIWKDILRTGVWSHTPTQQGLIKKRLQIVRDGDSDPVNGIISLSEIYNNFQDRAIPYVTVPLSDDKEDHKNIARLNTGYVRQLKLVDRGDGFSVLRAGIDFTEPDVKEKILRGTYPDVSAGVPYGVIRRDDNKSFGSVLDHVCITRKPFVSNLGPFGIAAADSDTELPIEAWEQEAADPAHPSPVSITGEPPPTISKNGDDPANESEPKNEPESEEIITMSFRQMANAIRTALTNQLRLGPEYSVEDIIGTTATISHNSSSAKWNVPFRIAEQNLIVVASVDKWKLIEEHRPEPIAASNSVDEFTRAKQLRELRLSQPNSTGGIQMSVLSLDGVELSDLPEEARNRIQGIVAENRRLNRSDRESKADKRTSELEVLFKDRPGALKFYREVMMSDDEGPAIVLFTDGDENKKERLTAVQILDRFIEALKVGDQINFSDQHLASGNDNRPPTDTTGEKEDLETRVAKSRTALYGDKNKRRTGRK